MSLCQGPPSTPRGTAPAPTARPSHLGAGASPSQARGRQGRLQERGERGHVGPSGRLGGACACRAATVVEYPSFEDMVRTSDVPILVDFHAQWCGPCQLMSTVLGGISEELKGKLSVVKIDTDRYPRLATKYHVKALPTLLLFRDGVAIDRVEGFMAERQLADRMRFYCNRMDKKLGRR